MLFVGIYSLAKEPSRSSGEIWNTSSAMVKVAFVVGFRGGIGMSLNKLAPALEGSTREELSDGGKAWKKLSDLSNFIDEHEPAIENVMTDLYKDPANTYICWVWMFEVACQKLKGEDIEPLLRESRKEPYINIYTQEPQKSLLPKIKFTDDFIKSQENLNNKKEEE